VPQGRERGAEPRAPVGARLPDPPPPAAEFDAGSEAAARARGLSPETAAGIRKWLDENEDEPMPGMRKRD
jgi:hypothetical protein